MVQVQAMTLGTAAQVPPAAGHTLAYCAAECGTRRAASNPKTSTHDTWGTPLGGALVGAEVDPALLGDLGVPQGLQGGEQDAGVPLRRVGQLLWLLLPFWAWAGLSLVLSLLLST